MALNLTINSSNPPLGKYKCDVFNMLQATLHFAAELAHPVQWIDTQNILVPSWHNLKLTVCHSQCSLGFSCLSPL